MKFLAMPQIIHNYITGSGAVVFILLLILCLQESSSNADTLDRLQQKVGPERSKRSNGAFDTVRSNAGPRHLPPFFRRNKTEFVCYKCKAENSDSCYSHEYCSGPACVTSFGHLAGVTVLTKDCFPSDPSFFEPISAQCINEVDQSSGVNITICTCLNDYCNHASSIVNPGHWISSCIILTLIYSAIWMIASAREINY